jgi:hypothetical protein
MSKKVTKKAAKPSAKADKTGRPSGTGKFGCPTKVIRVPEHLVEEVIEYVRKKLKTKAAA